jgi:hypothetical protein
MPGPEELRAPLESTAYSNQACVRFGPPSCESASVALLENLHIDFAVIGGIATSVRGEPRMTEDVDLLIDAEEGRFAQLVHQLKSEGLGVDAKTSIRSWESKKSAELAYDGTVLEMVRGSSYLDSSILGRARPATVLSRDVRLATVEDCIFMRAKTWRLKDVPVALDLVERHCRAIDRDYLEYWTEKLHDRGVSDRMTALFDRDSDLPPGQRKP